MSGAVCTPSEILCRGEGSAAATRCAFGVVDLPVDVVLPTHADPAEAALER